jgi:hypothetical protein
MRFRRVTLLLVLFVALDFATPMMPGAVQLIDDGSLEMDAGHYARRAKHQAPAVTLLPRDLSTVMHPRKPTLPTGQVNCTSPPAPVTFRAPLESHSTPASSPDDD